MTEVFIFKTSAHTPAHVAQLAALFRPLGSIQQWSVDLEDCDRILRIVASGLRPAVIERLLATAGIAYERMEYEL